MLPRLESEGSGEGGRRATVALNSIDGTQAEIPAARARLDRVYQGSDSGSGESAPPIELPEGIDWFQMAADKMKMVLPPNIGEAALELLSESEDKQVQEVSAAIFDITYKRFVDRLIELHGKGVKVRVLMDRTQARGAFSQYKRMKEAGLDVLILTGKTPASKASAMDLAQGLNFEGRMHEKVMFARFRQFGQDKKAAMWGSANASLAAFGNEQEWRNWELATPTIFPAEAPNTMVEKISADFEALWELAKHEPQTVSIEELVEAPKEVDFSEIEARLPLKSAVLKKLFGQVDQDWFNIPAKIWYAFLNPPQIGEAVLRALNQGRTDELLVAMYTLSYAPLLDAVIRLRQSGTRLKVIVDKKNADGAKIKRLLDAGVDVRILGGRISNAIVKAFKRAGMHVIGGIMHCKLLLARRAEGARVSAWGSANASTYSWGDEGEWGNREMLTLSYSPKDSEDPLFDRFQQAFDLLWSLATPAHNPGKKRSTARKRGKRGRRASGASGSPQLREGGRRVTLRSTGASIVPELREGADASGSPLPLQRSGTIEAAVRRVELREGGGRS